MKDDDATADNINTNSALLSNTEGWTVSLSRKKKFTTSQANSQEEVQLRLGPYNRAECIWPYWVGCVYDWLFASLCIVPTCSDVEAGLDNDSITAPL